MHLSYGGLTAEGGRKRRAGEGLPCFFGQLAEQASVPRCRPYLGRMMGQQRGLEIILPSIILPQFWGGRWVLYRGFRTSSI